MFQIHYNPKKQCKTIELEKKLTGFSLESNWVKEKQKLYQKEEEKEKNKSEIEIEISTSVCILVMCVRMR
jgi:hypothetical protein